MSDIPERLRSVWEQIITVFQDLQLKDLLDIALVALILYSVIKLIRETRAVQLAKGLLFMGMGYLLISALRMQASQFLLERVFTDFILVLIILFQPEIRHAFESVGRSNLRNVGLLIGRGKQEQQQLLLHSTVLTIVQSCEEMSEKNIGALIVFEHKTLLGDVAKTGIELEAKVTPELVQNIFFPNSPLHDGAAIIREEHIYAAGCVLPLTQNPDVPSDLGMRHRAALGMSESSDAMVLVTSEETGGISLAHKGELQRELTGEQLREELLRVLVPGAVADSSIKSVWSQIFRMKK